MWKGRGTRRHRKRIWEGGAAVAMQGGRWCAGREGVGQQILLVLCMGGDWFGQGAARGGGAMTGLAGGVVAGRQQVLELGRRKGLWWTRRGGGGKGRETGFPRGAGSSSKAVAAWQALELGPRGCWGGGRRILLKNK